MAMLSDVQALIMLALWVGAFVCGLVALVDAVRHDAGSFAAEGKQTKTFWLVVLGVALAVLLAIMPRLLDMFGLIAVVAIGVYLADVRPALAPYRRRRAQRRAGGSGPYGSW